jgi:hypothetical protein
MYGDYLVMCGMAWAQFGRQDAGLELVRALDSPEQDVRVLARILLEQASDGAKELIGQALAEDEISPSVAKLCSFKHGKGPNLGELKATIWRSTASA